MQNLLKAIVSFVKAWGLTIRFCKVTFNHGIVQLWQNLHQILQSILLAHFDSTFDGLFSHTWPWRLTRYELCKLGRRKRGHCSVYTMPGVDKASAQCTSHWCSKTCKGGLVLSLGHLGEVSLHPGQHLLAQHFCVFCRLPQVSPPHRMDVCCYESVPMQLQQTQVLGWSAHRSKKAASERAQSTGYP